MFASEFRMDGAVSAKFKGPDQIEAVSRNGRKRTSRLGPRLLRHGSGGSSLHEAAPPGLDGNPPGSGLRRSFH